MVSKVDNPRYGIGSSPIWELCQSGNLPRSPLRGVKADWSSVSFASVSQIAALAAIHLCGRLHGENQIISGASPTIRGYLKRIDYFKMAGIEEADGFQRHDPADRFVQLSEIETNEDEADPNGISTRVRRVITRRAAMSRSVEGQLDLAFGEIVDNVVQHSKSPSPGIACAQYYQKDGYVEVCVADCGRGIASSMAENPAYAELGTGTLLSMAFEENTGEWYGRSSVGTNQVSGGKGLSFSSRLVRATGGHIWAVSHGDALHISSDTTESVDGLWYPGTLLVMRVPETSREVLESDLVPGGRDEPALWDQVEGSYVDSDLLW